MAEILYETVNLANEFTKNKIINFLQEFQLNYTEVDLTIVAWKQNKIIGVCSKKNNLIKNIAIADEYKGLNIANTMVTMVIKAIWQEDYKNIFVITKFENKKIFFDLNFKLIYENEKISFLAVNDADYKSYKDYILNLEYKSKTAFIILNANPMTLGHRYLIDQAAKENDLVYLIPVNEDSSFFTTTERIEIISENIKDINNVKLLNGTDYLISKNLFPSYFLQSDEDSIREQAMLDANLFCDFVSGKKNICRYVGDEPFSKTTNKYNLILNEVLNNKNITLKIIKRCEINEKPISASKVREAIFNKDLKTVKQMVSTKTFAIISNEKFLKRAQEQPNKIFKNN